MFKEFQSLFMMMYMRW